MTVIPGMLLIIAVTRVLASLETPEVNSDFSLDNGNCSTTEGLVTVRFLGDERHEEIELMDVVLDGTKNETNASRLKWDEQVPKLKFPKFESDDRYKMPNLNLGEGLFVFDFLRSFLFVVHPYDIPLDLLKDAVDNRITVWKLITESMHLEVVFLCVVGITCLLACVVPGTEFWLACRPIREDYKPSGHPTALAFFLWLFICILGTCMVTMIACNEATSEGIKKLPLVVETALQDLNDYHAETASQLRKCLTRSLDVASEAILADLDNVEELLGTPVQAELSSETGLDVALDALLDLANASRVLSGKAELLLKDAETAWILSTELSRETEEIRRDLEATVRTCSGQDRPLCAIIDPSGLRLALRIESLLKDDHLERLRATSRENLTEASRQAREEYFNVPDHIARDTLDARNQIRREINGARARVFDEARSMEASSSELSKHLQSARNAADYAIPYVTEFEHVRWLVGFGTVVGIFLLWSLVFGALCCRCGSSDDRVRPTLLCSVLTSCLVSIALWTVFIMTLALSSHTEMLFCRPLYDPDYRTLEAVLETRAFLGKRASVPLKDLFQKCRENEPAYPAFGSSVKLDHLTAHWTWSGLYKAMSNLRVDLTSLRIFTPSLQYRLQNLLYACGLNLTEHRITIQGPILNKDMEAVADQLDNVARQLSGKAIARKLQTIGLTMRDLTLRRVKPLTKLQDDIVYQLAGLELQVQPLQRQLNQSISHLKTIQYYIDNQGEKIAQLKAKAYVERLGNYLEQWRVHALSETGTGMARCRPIWDILEGLRFLLCQHILGPLDGFWFVTFLCALVMIASTPTAHVLSLVYRKPSTLTKDIALLPRRSDSVDTQMTVTVDRDTWQTPDPPPPQDGW